MLLLSCARADGVNATAMRNSKIAIPAWLIKASRLSLRLVTPPKDPRLLQCNMCNMKPTISLCAAQYVTDCICFCTVQNAGTEVSTEWVLAHMEDADFNDPLPEPSAGGNAPAAEAESGADAESVALLSSMGFTDAQAAAALKVKRDPSSHPRPKMQHPVASPERAAYCCSKMSRAAHAALTLTLLRTFIAESWLCAEPALSSLT